MTGLRLQGVRKSYGSLEVIGGVDLEIREGEFVVFVGPSGCGKSTLLRMIAGLEPITSGELTIGGRRMNEVDPSRRGIAMVFQSYALYPHLNVRENMGFALRFAGLPAAEIAARVTSAARVLGLDGLLDRRPRALSGGQRQRVAIGRAIVRQPDVFLFDEPLSNLDAELRMHMRIEIARLHKALEATIIYVTHDQVEAMTLADRIVVLRAGRVEQVGTPLELHDDPDNVFVATFIGSPKMNLLAARRRGDRLDLEDLPGQSLPLPPFAAGLPEAAEVTVGLRPDLFRRGGPAEIEFVVDIVEQLGTETLLHARPQAKGAMLTAVGERALAVRPGQKRAFGLDPGKMLLFDAQGKRIR
jgi:lactose/L-arabinose transport system ATP-binding protein